MNPKLSQVKHFTNTIYKSSTIRSERGITLVALIITIIVLVILAAVSIAAVYNSRVVDYAINGATGYADESIRENEIMSGTESLLDSTINRIEDIVTGKTLEEPKKEALTAEELSSKIGAYVDYQPDTEANAKYSTTQDGAERSGYGSRDITRDTNLTWRIMAVEGNTLTLIATTPASGTLNLKGQNGYNNGVKLLNDACSTLYSNSTLGTTARSINVDDINSLMGVTPSTALDSNYGTEYTPSNKNYPAIFPYESWGSVNGRYNGSLGQSEQPADAEWSSNGWYSGGGQASTLKGKYSHYSYTLSNYKATSTVQHALATCQAETTGTTSHMTYWLASRCVEFSGNYARFRMFIVINGRADYSGLYNSGNGTFHQGFAVRPVVSITLNSIAIGRTGSGSSEDSYSISKN